VNAWQDFRQLQYLIRAQTWPDGATVAFSSQSVIISASPIEETAEKIILPMAIIRPGGATSDQDDPDLLDQEVVISLGVGHAGDAYGEHPMVGGQRTSQTRSQGRGLLEVEEVLFNAVELLNTDDGVVIQFKAKSAPAASYIASQYYLFRDYLFSLICTADRFYHPVINLQES